MALDEDLARIEQGLRRAGEVLAAFTPGEVAHKLKGGGDPVTEADTAINDVLLEILPRGDDGWLSEETADSADRLERDRVWVVDPLDGTREFIAGIPEWCVSIGLVVSGVAVAGGIYGPTRDLLLVGAVGHGVMLNGQPCRTRELASLEGAEVLASRSEVKRGEWDRFETAPFAVRPTGSVALKMALVAAGQADATWTLVPKHEWDVAAGSALVTAAGGRVWTPEGEAPRFNKRTPKFTGLLACPSGLAEPIAEFLREPIRELRH